jgi:GNAT superfamily N-acetyltransferase
VLRGVSLRALTLHDLEGVVAIDTALSRGRSRRVYFERRLDAALKQPQLHVQFAADYDGALIGYVLARKLAGEFGRAEPALRLEVIGVRPIEQGHGVGRQLVDRLGAFALKHGIRELRTQASWRDHTMLGFLDAAGFALGRNHVLDCSVQSAAFGGSDSPEGEILDFGRQGAEIDYSARAANDFEALARDRAEVRSLAPDDLPEILRIDRRITGRAREVYLEQIFAEALSDKGVRVSLAAKHEGVFAGYVMAKTDFGDFGRTEPVAVIDTIGVDPDAAHHGVGSALLSQLFLNLHALHVERVETVVTRENFDLLGFFYRAGFAPAERLAFVKPLA